MAAATADVARRVPALKNVNWFRTVKQTVKEFMADDALGMGAEMAYHFLFALFPSLLMLFAILGLIESLAPGPSFQQQLLTLMQQSLPQVAYEALQPIIDTTLGRVGGGGAGAILSFSFIIAIWSASSGTQSLMKGFNIAYDVADTRNFVKKKLIAIALAVGIALFGILTLALLVFGGQIGQAIADAVGLGGMFAVVWNIGRWVLMGILLIVGLALLYYFAPNVDQEFVWISPGSIVAAILWFVATIAFTFYVNTFAGYSSYGVVGGIIALVYWMYISSLVLLIGAEMNGVLTQKHDPKTIQDPKQKATGEGTGEAVRGAGGRMVGAAAAASQQEQEPEGAAGSGQAAGRQGGGRHRGAGRQDEPRNTPDWRNRLGRQDPERVAARRREGEQKNQANGKNGRNGRQSGTDTDTAPAKGILWGLLHDGGLALAVHGTKELLAIGWRNVFNTPPPTKTRLQRIKEQKKQREKARSH